MDAILLPQLFQVTASSCSESGKTSIDNLVPRPTSLIILRCIIPIYNSSSQLQASHLVYSPLSLFLTQQNVLSKVSRANFIRDTRKEFYAVFARSMNVSTYNSESTTPSRWSLFKRRSLLSDATPPAWQLGSDLESGPSNSYSQDHQTLVEAGQGIPSTTIDSPSRSRKASFSGILLQKSVSVTVRDKDFDDTIHQPSALSASSKSASVTECEPGDYISPLDDDATWADICFKGILK